MTIRTPEIGRRFAFALLGTGVALAVVSGAAGPDGPAERLLPGPRRPRPAGGQSERPLRPRGVDRRLRVVLPLGGDGARSESVEVHLYRRVSTARRFAGAEASAMRNSLRRTVAERVY